MLRLKGRLASGFSIMLTLSDRQGREIVEAQGQLPTNPALSETLAQWRTCYRDSQGNSRLGPVSVEVEPGSLAQLETCRQLGVQLQQQFALWLASEAFRPIDQRLREALTPQGETQILLRSEDPQLHRLPWHRWDLVERYPRTEVIFGSAPQQVKAGKRVEAPGVRVLAILGDRRNIDIDIDRQLLEALPQAEVTFLVEPSRQQVDTELWEQPWDILFFAGHSASIQDQGHIAINAAESLTLEELRYGLGRAIRFGLQLAIFNSCDGLGLAYALETLPLPQLIVMREPVADQVAQQFLKAFLDAFSRGESLALALREARERLQGWESDFPWATWLPVLFQNPAATAPTWESLQGEDLAEIPDPAMLPALRPQQRQPRSVPVWLKFQGQAVGKALLTGMGIATLILGARSLGWMESAELAVFDQFLRNRPSEPEEDRIIVLEVTDADIDQQPAAERQGRSLSDKTLNQLLKQLTAADPAVIALDIYREAPTPLVPLQQQFANNPQLIAVCKGQDSARNIPGIAPPPEVPPERLGFSDAQGDADGIVRLQLLAALPQPNSPCPTDFSLSAAIAEQYLYGQGLALSFPDAHTWQWGDLERSDQLRGDRQGQSQLQRIGAAWPNQGRTYIAYGPYAKLNTQGHKLWLNYRVHQPEPGQPKSPEQAFLRISLGELLSGQVSPESLQDKIVLVGVNAAQSDDHWPTPYRNREGETLTIAGVYLQAQMTSQILSAVLDGRSLLRSLAWPWEMLGMVLLGAIAAVLGRNPNWPGVLLGPGLIAVGCWGAFAILSLYLPLLAWLLVWLLAAGAGGVSSRLTGSVKGLPPKN